MNKKTMTLVGMAMLTAIVVVLQAMAIGIHFGPFAITLTLIPIIVGAALYGWWAGAWLGFVFGMVVLFTDAAAFWVVSPIGTIITCLLKGMLAGAVAGLLYKALEAKNKIVAVLAAAVTTPIVNTGVFLLGCYLFFYETVSAWGQGLGFANTTAYLIFGMVGLNFIVEAAINIALSSAVVGLIKVLKRTVNQ